MTVKPISRPHADKRMIEEALAAKCHLDATGIHMTMQVFSKWIEELASDPEALPEITRRNSTKG